MKRPSSPKPFYTSVCHTFENGAIKTKGPSLKWLRPACQKNEHYVRKCLRNQYRNKGRCMMCLPGYRCQGKCICSFLVHLG
jgi:hypothetical protein